MLMRTRLLSLFLLIASSPFLRAQESKIPPDIEKLSARAKETVEVTMEGPMLRWASKFLSAEDADEQKAAKLVANLKGIYVRSFEFDKDGEYSSADVDLMRTQFHAPEWNRIVGVRSQKDGENVDVFFRLENDKMAGIVVIAAEPRELTFVHIDGPLEIEDLAELGGDFGIPKLNSKNAIRPSKSGSKSDPKAGKGDSK
jgi:hypothetical protein